jgi:hypothetical protein
MNGNPSALATSLIALGGAVIGGLLTFLGQWLLERRRVEREERREERLTLGAARLMQQDFHRAKALLLVSADSGLWWDVNRELMFNIAMEDRRVLAARLSHDAWATVVVAEAQYEGWNRLRAEDTFGPIDATRAALMRQAADDMEEGMTVLIEFERGLTRPRR